VAALAFDVAQKLRSVAGNADAPKYHPASRVSRLHGPVPVSGKLLAVIAQRPPLILARGALRATW
jgi:hypothetical protein